MQVEKRKKKTFVPFTAVALDFGFDVETLRRIAFVYGDQASCPHLLTKFYVKSSSLATQRSANTSERSLEFMLYQGLLQEISLRLTNLLGDCFLDPRPCSTPSHV